MSSHLRIIIPASPALVESEQRTGPDASGKHKFPIALDYLQFFRSNAWSVYDVVK